MNNLVHHTKRFWRRHGSTVLTCAGGVGVVATTVMAVKATPKALQLIEQAKEEKGEELTKFEVVKVAGPTYIPTVITGVSALACIFGANVLNKKHQVSMAGAYALVDNSYKEYKKKVEELYGEEGSKQVRAEIAKDHYDENDIEGDPEDGKNLFYDEFSGRYFNATNETVLRAEYMVNKILNEDCGVYLNEWYELLGVSEVDYGNYMGWSAAQMSEMYWSSWIDFYHERVVMDDGLECYIIRMTEPTPDFAEY